MYGQRSFRYYELFYWNEIFIILFFVFVITVII